MRIVQYRPGLIVLLVLTLVTVASAQLSGPTQIPANWHRVVSGIYGELDPTVYQRMFARFMMEHGVSWVAHVEAMQAMYDEPGTRLSDAVCELQARDQIAVEQLLARYRLQIICR